MQSLIFLQNHRSIRKFTNVPVSAEQREAILQAAQAASTSSNMQAYSVIHVTDAEPEEPASRASWQSSLRQRVPAIPRVVRRPHRYAEAVHLHVDTPVTGNAENFIIATVDAALAAQNAAIAAESLGLGVCYIGGLRNKPAEVSELLGLPQLVYPVFGMCIGMPDQEPLQSPAAPARSRIPRESVYAKQRRGRVRMTRRIRDYMNVRTDGKVDTTWSKEMAAKAQRPRKHMKAFLSSQGFEVE